MADEAVLLRIRPSLPDPDETSAARGPLMMESVLSALHSLHGKGSTLSLEIGLAEGKICLFARAKSSAASLVESQLYGQYPDSEIEVEKNADLFEPAKDEAVTYCDLVL